MKCLTTALSYISTGLVFIEIWKGWGQTDLQPPSKN